LIREGDLVGILELDDGIRSIELGCCLIKAFSSFAINLLEFASITVESEGSLLEFLVLCPSILVMLFNSEKFSLYASWDILNKTFEHHKFE